jgi:hypothetical protein
MKIPHPTNHAHTVTDGALNQTTILVRAVQDAKNRHI